MVLPVRESISTAQELMCGGRVVINTGAGGSKALPGTPLPSEALISLSIVM